MNITINGRNVDASPDVRTSLLDLLRDHLGLTGTKKGCNQGACGACTVLVDGERIVSCLALAVQYFGRSITTVDGVERMIEQMGLPATILRPAYFMNNDVTVKDVVTRHGVYPMPLGTKGIAMVDARDIGEIAAIELIRREQSATALPLVRINLVGPDTLTGTDVAAIWTEVLGRTIGYGGDDTVGFEQNLRQFMPGWMAYDMRLTAERFLTDGMVPEAGDVERLTALLGRPLRSYRAFAAEIAGAA